MTSDFTAAAILITFGAVLGKASRLQLFVMAVIECIFFAINEAIILEFLHISDVGGSIVVHLFGAYFGLAVATVLQNHGGEHPNESSSKSSDLFAMAGKNITIYSIYEIEMHSEKPCKIYDTVTISLFYQNMLSIG